MIRLTKKHKYLRSIVQTIFFVLFLAISVNTVLFDLNKSSLPPVSLQGICPFGGVTALYILITTGTLISPATVSILILSLLFGSVFCGWICPLGALQDLITKLTRNLHVKKYNNIISPTIDRYLRFIRYVVLSLVICSTLLQIVHNLRIYCIYHSIVGIWTAYTATAGFVILIIIIISTAFFVERPWCKYLCPYGTLLGITNRFRFFKITRKLSSCINCKQCDYKCPMNITVSKKTYIHDVQCISCFKCTSENNCPIEDTIILENGINHVFSIKQKNLALSLVIVVAVSISISYSISNKLWIPSNNPIINADVSLSQQIKDSETNSNSKYNDGTYEGLSVAYRPGLKVLVTIKNDIITNIEIVSHRESKGYFEESFNLIPKLIIDNQSTQVDSISGATKTVDGIKKAVENALKKAQN